MTELKINTVRSAIVVSPDGVHLTITRERPSLILTQVHPQLTISRWGSRGLQGNPGPSAYETAVAEGFVGDEAAWLLTMKGTPGSVWHFGVGGPPNDPDLTNPINDAWFDPVSGEVWIHEGDGSLAGNWAYKGVMKGTAGDDGLGFTPVFLATLEQHVINNTGDNNFSAVLPMIVNVSGQDVSIAINPATQSNPGYLEAPDKIKLNNLSGVNTGDQDLSGLQPLDPALTALAATNWAANTIAIGTAANTVAQLALANYTFPARLGTGGIVALTISDFGAGLIAQGTLEAAALLGLGTAAYENVGAGGNTVPLCDNSSNEFSGGLWVGTALYVGGANYSDDGSGAKFQVHGSANISGSGSFGTSIGVGVPASSSVAVVQIDGSAGWNGNKSHAVLITTEHLDSSTPSSARGVAVEANIRSTGSLWGPVPTYAAFHASKGATVGVAVTTMHGFYVDANMVFGDNSYGFYGAIPVGAGRYNLFMAGTAPNYLGGALSVAGKTTLSGSTVGGAGLNLPQGQTPSAPENGDVWITISGMYVRVNGVTVGPFSMGGGTATGTNTGDQTSIVGITGSLAEFNAALTGADFATGGGTVSGASSGTNTGDQTITLTGDVTGSGTGSFVATIANAAVSLAKLANMATGSLFYRKTAGSGPPEVQTLATLKTDLGLTGTNTGDQNFSGVLPMIVNVSGSDVSIAINPATAGNPGYLEAADKIKLNNTSGVNTGDQDLSGLQPIDATLTALAATNWAANSFPLGSGVNTLTQFNLPTYTFPGRLAANVVALSITDWGLSLISQGPTETKAALGLGTAAYKNTGAGGNTVPLYDNSSNEWSGGMSVEDFLYVGVPNATSDGSGCVFQVLGSANFSAAGSFGTSVGIGVPASAAQAILQVDGNAGWNSNYSTGILVTSQHTDTSTPTAARGVAVVAEIKSTGSLWGPIPHYSAFHASKSATIGCTVTAVHGFYVDANMNFGDNSYAFYGAIAVAANRYNLYMAGTAANYLAGALTVDGLVLTAASTTGSAGFRIPHGAAPTSPVNGDLWTTTAGLYARINGVTVGPYAVASGAATWGSITGTLSSQTDLQNALNLKANLASPALTGTATAVNLTLSGLLLTPASIAGSAYLRLPHGVAPATPTNGDFWTTTAGVYARINGVTVGPFAAATGGATWGSITGTLSGQTDLQNALNLKANLASPTFTGTVGGITAAMVGLGSVNNTTDSAKPVSTAQQTALDLKANLASPTFTGTVNAVTIVASSSITSSQVFNTTTTSLVLAPAAGAGTISMRPNGAGTGTGEATISNTGALTLRDSAGAASSTPTLTLQNGTRNLYFLPWSGAGSYNSSSQAGDTSLVALGAAVDTGVLNLTIWGNTAVGVRIAPTTVTLTGTSINLVGDRVATGYGEFRGSSGNAWARFSHAYYGVQDHLSISGNFKRTSASAGTIDSASLGTAEVLITPTNGGGGVIALRVGAANTAPSTVAQVSGGLLAVTGLVDSTAYRATGDSTFASNVQGMEMYVNAGNGNLLSYNRGAATYHPMRIAGSTVFLLSGATIIGTFSSTGLAVVGTVSDTKGDLRVTPITNTTGSGGNLTLTNAGTSIRKSNSVAQNWTLPPNSTAAFPIGTMITFHNAGGTTLDMTISRDAGVSIYHQSATSADIVLTPGQSVTLQKTDTDTWQG